ncbi:MAG: VIT domain-containing protein [Myxococcaceae bacterium]
MSFAPRNTPSPDPSELTGGRLVSIDGRALPLIGAALTADAKGGVVRVVLEQTFRNPHDEPLRVTYTLPLPADGAVSGFAFRIGEERVVGQVDLKQRARQRFEEAVLEGRTAALLDQERSSLFTQEVGNVPPRTQVICEVQIDQKLVWLPDGAWEWRFPTVVAPRYMRAPGRVADVAKVTVDVADGELPVKLSMSMAIRDELLEGVRPESPSHPMHSGKGLGRTDVTFGDERGVALDRDVVVRWRVAGLQVGTALDVHRPASGPNSTSAFGLLTLVPPKAEARMTPVARDLIVLLDTSGSMSGAPLDQARRVTMALVDSLTDRDQLELIEFSNSPRRWKRGAVAATEANRRDAAAWLSRLRASGGTEMRTGILEALAPLRTESQRQVILITDGLIGFESEVLEAISRRLPKGSRVHTVGVGSGVNRSLTMPAARAGRGVELVIGLGEDVEPFVKRLMARTNAPLLTEVEISGSAVVGVAPSRLPDLYGGSPALASLKLRPEGGEIIVRARSADGEIEERLQVRSTVHGEGSAAVATLFGRELVEDFELSIACGGQKAELDPQIERTGVDFQISTRLTSWVAVSAKQTVDPRAPRRHETMPHELAYGLSAEGVGLRQASGPAQAGPMGAVGGAAAAPVAPGAPVLSRMRTSTRAVANEKQKSSSTTGSFKSLDVSPPAEDEPSMAEEAEAGAAFDDAADGSVMRDELAGAPPPPPSASAPAKPSFREVPPPARRPAAPKPEPEADGKKDEAPKKKEGLLDFARRLFQGAPPEDKPAAPATKTPAGRKGQARSESIPEPVQAPSRRVRGKVRRQGKKLIIEIDVAQDLTWGPGGEAQLELSDGTFAKVPVDAALTTAAGKFGPGLTITLVLVVDESVGEVSTVHLSNGGEVLAIDL